VLIPFLRKGNLISFVGKSGFKLSGKEGETNILTGDKINYCNGFLFSKSTLVEIEVWEIIYYD
jgi:hypothetical protein